MNPPVRSPAINPVYLTGSHRDWPLAELAAIGYRGLELTPACLEEPASWRAAAQRANLQVAAVNALPELTPYLTGSLSDNVAWRREETRARLRRTMDRMREVEAPFLIVAPGRLAENYQTPDEARARLIESLWSLSEAAGDDVLLLLASAPFRLFSRQAEIASIIDEVARPNVAAALDVGHTLLSGEEPGKAIPALGTRLRYLQWNDADTTPGVPRLDRHLPLGQGAASAAELRPGIDALPYAVNIVAPDDPVHAAAAALAWLRP